jgi:Tol biopolymer transport system component
VRIAYLDGANLSMMQTDGTGSALLARDLQPTQCAPYYISPNGQWVAYQQAADGLWVVPTAGGSASELSDAVAGSVSWFPDSSGVVYTRDDAVYAQWLDPSRPAQPMAVGGRSYLFPTWSPDGKYIAFLETTDEANIFNVILIQSDGTGWRTLGATPPEASDRRLCPEIIAWSPDSTRFLVDFGDPAFAFYVSGGSPVQLGAGPTATNYAWAPDGRSLIYQDDGGYLWLVAADGRDNKQLTGFPVGEAAWSPVAQQVAYVARRDADSALEILDIETGAARSLTGSDNFVESNPRWSPDGRFLVFARSNAGAGTSAGEDPVSAGIWRVPAEGSEPPQRLAVIGASLEVFAIR